jgi:hypothetical protein
LSVLPLRAMHSCPTASGAHLLPSAAVHSMTPRQNLVQAGLLGRQMRFLHRLSLQFRLALFSAART